MRVLAVILISALLASCTGGKVAREVSGAFTVGVSDSLLSAGKADTLDMGKVRGGENLFRTIYLRNDSDKPLIILGAETACSCVKAEYWSSPISPGDKAPVKVWFYSSGLDSGWQYKPVTLRTSLGGGRYRIIVTAEVVKD